MFTKLLKQNWRARWGVLGILCLICLSAAVLGGGSMRYLVWASNQSETMKLPTALCVLAMVMSFVAIAVCCVAQLFFQLWRFYKSCFTDEGYLTFTLPVTTHEILLSSLINTFLGVLLMVVVACVSLGGLLLLGFSGVEGFWPALWELLPRLLQDVANSLTGELLGYGLMMLLAGTLGFICEIILLMLCITIGAMVAKKHKLLAAVGAYYGIQVAVSIVEAVFLASQVVRVVGEANIFFRVFGMNSILMLILSLLSYFAMYYLTDRKLNLA